MIYYLTLEATITKFETIPYVEHELKDVDKGRRDMIHQFELEKVLDEVVTDRIVAENINHLRKQIMQVYRRFHPNPIVVYTDVFPVHSYITTIPYRNWIPSTIGEQILFRYVEGSPSEDKVVCRIIGRDNRALYRYGRYCIERHNDEGSLDSDFNYPKTI